MSVKIMGQLWDLQLAHRELLLLLAITDHADHDGRNMFPSIDLLAYKTGYSRSTVKRVLHALVERGVLERQERPGKSSLYNIRLDRIEKKPPREQPTRSKLNRVNLNRVHSYEPPTRFTVSANVNHDPSVEPSSDQEVPTERQKAVQLLAAFYQSKTGGLVAGWARADLDLLVEDYSLARLQAAIANTGDRPLQKPFLYLRKVLSNAELVTPAAPAAPSGPWGRELT